MYIRIPTPTRSNFLLVPGSSRLSQIAAGYAQSSDDVIIQTHISEKTGHGGCHRYGYPCFNRWQG